MIASQRQHRQHQVRGDFGGAAHAHPARAELVLEAGIDPLDLGADLEAFGGMRGEVDLLPAARVVIDQGEVVQIAAVLSDERTAVSGVHEIVEAGHARGSQRGQRDDDLRIVDAGAGDHGTDGDLAKQASVSGTSSCWNSVWN